MKKEEIYVSVESKEQAEQYIEIMLTMKVHVGSYWMNNGENKYLRCCFDGRFSLCSTHVGLKKINFGELIDLLTKPQKIAVRVDNEKEFNALMKYYDSLGWNHVGLDRPFKLKDFEYVNCFTFHDKWFSVKDNEIDYQIIPFSDFAKEHNIKLPLIKSEDGVWLYEGDSFFSVRVYNKDIVERLLTTEWAGISSKNLVKGFSTKQAAIEWIEAQKPKFPLINETKKEVVTEYEIEFNEKSSVLITKDNVKFNGSEFNLTQLEVLAIVSKFKSLQ